MKILILSCLVLAALGGTIREIEPAAFDWTNAPTAIILTFALENDLPPEGYLEVTLPADSFNIAGCSVLGNADLSCTLYEMDSDVAIDN